MTPGPDLILRLHKSESLVRITTINSGNTFGATSWTDSYTECPMMPDDPPLQVHPVSGELFLVRKCKRVAKVAMTEQDDWKHVPYAEDPTAEHYVRALNEGLASTTKLKREFRICLWWLHNHSVRETGQHSAPREEFRSNLTALLGLLPADKTGNSSDRLLAAEIHRELEQFDEATLELAAPFEGYLEQVASRIRELSEAHDPLVRQLLEPDTEGNENFFVTNHTLSV